jgi:pimeloyl-ACP methyl ester carboxylesterase
LASAAVDINVFVDDIVNCIQAEELKDVVLVGHSFAGIPITGVAARIPELLASLIYLDAGVPNPGDSAISSLSQREQEARRKAAVTVGGVEFLMAPTPLPAFWGLSGADADWVSRRLTPHPFATYTSGLAYDSAVWARVPKTYIQCTAPRHPALGETQARVKADKQWRWQEIASGHDAMVSHPQELARLLVS